MRDAIRLIPDGKTRDVGFSTPDIYGRASQLYLALRKAQGNAQMPDTPEVRLWRGLLTLLALRHHQDLPLKWEAVTLTEGDTISGALKNPSFDRNDLLFDPTHPYERNYLWNGRNFYVLTWAPENAPRQDIAIYSPLTLLYPVADWQDAFYPPDASVLSADPNAAFHPIADFNAFLQRFFDKETRTFQNYTALQADERVFVSQWLGGMIQFLQRNGQSSGAVAAIHNLSQYQTDLNVNPKDWSGLEWKAFHDGANAYEDALPKPLWSAPSLSYGKIFADQVCYFKVSETEGNPFSDSGCQYSPNYEIKKTPEAGVRWYAFLPIHPDCRSKCIEDKLAESVKMRYRRDPTTNQDAVEVSMTPPGAPTQTRLYPIETKLTDMKGRAFCYKDRNGNDALLGMSSWPLIAVWPATIGQGWKEYYVARSDSESKCLRIYGEAGTGWTSKNGEAPPVRSGHNALAVKTTYVPDAIPFVRMIPGDNDEQIPVSVGVVTPAMQPASQAAPVTAEVAVDFGTSSSRVFYKLAGDTSDNACKELFVQLDEPLEVTAYKKNIHDGSAEETLDANKAALLSREFISPSGKRNANVTQTPLFSMFRRSASVPLNEVPPILEGVIYQPNKNDDSTTMESLITDLKWNGQNGIYYVPFMQQLCLHVMAYLYKYYHVNNINWHYALPKAMNPSLVEGMNSMWGTRIKDFLTQASGTNITQAILRPMTESVAASLYFNKYQQGYVQAHQGYLVVDIGGGSTDVALWQSDGLGLPPALKWHSSVQVAGRHMFTARLESAGNSEKSRIDCLAAGVTDNNDLQELLSKMRRAKLDDTTAYVDRLLSTYSKTLKSKYTELYQRSDGAWTRKMRGQILRSISLLMFALGYQVGLEIDSGCIKEPQAPGFFAICIGGRGSNVLDWLMLNQNYTELHALFTEGVAASRKDGKKWPEVKIQIVKSPDPKCEVAMGLLAQDGNVDSGWTFQSSQDVMDDPNYCPEAAERFLEAFNRTFPEQSATDVQNPDLMNPDGTVNKDLLTGYISRRIGPMAKKDDAFRVLMESIHEML